MSLWNVPLLLSCKLFMSQLLPMKKRFLLWNFKRDECAFLLTQFRFLHDWNISSLYVFDLFLFASPMCSSWQMLLSKRNKYEILSIKSYFYVCLSAEFVSPSSEDGFCFIRNQTRANFQQPRENKYLLKTWRSLSKIFNLK